MIWYNVLAQIQDAMQEFRSKVKSDAKLLILDPETSSGYGITAEKPKSEVLLPLSHFVKLRVEALIGRDGTGWGFVNALDSQVSRFI